MLLGLQLVEPGFQLLPAQQLLWLPHSALVPGQLSQWQHFDPPVGHTS